MKFTKIVVVLLIIFLMPIQSAQANFFKDVLQVLIDEARMSANSVTVISSGDCVYDLTEFHYELDSMSRYDQSAKILRYKDSSDGEWYDTSPRLRSFSSYRKFNFLDKRKTIVNEYNTEDLAHEYLMARYRPDKDGNLVKYSVESPKFYGAEKETPVAIFKKTQEAIIPPYPKYPYDKNGKIVHTVEQTVFEEITQYDLKGNVISIFQKDKWGYIKELNPDRTLKANHNTKFIPYLLFSDYKNR